MCFRLENSVISTKHLSLQKNVQDLLKRTSNMEKLVQKMDEEIDEALQEMGKVVSRIDFVIY